MIIFASIFIYRISNNFHISDMGAGGFQIFGYSLTALANMAASYFKKNVQLHHENQLKLNSFKNKF